MYVSLGTDLVVTTADLPRAQALVRSVESENAAADKAYKKAYAAYEKAVASRLAVIADIDRRKAEYARALATYDTAARGIAASNGAATGAYQADLARWQEAYNREYAYGQAVSAQAREHQARAAAVLAKYRVAPPPGFSGCISAADQAAYAGLCAQQSRPVTVKGLGAIQVTPGTPGCAYAELPVCKSLGPKPPSAGNRPTPPSLLPMPKKPTLSVPPVPPVPVPPPPPVLKPIPQITVKDGSGPPPSTAGGLRTAGLLAALVVGGGAAAYYWKRKRKASS